MRRVGGGTQCSKLVSLGQQLAEALVVANTPMDVLAKANALSSVILASALADVLVWPAP